MKKIYSEILTFLLVSVSLMAFGQTVVNVYPQNVNRWTGSSDGVTIENSLIDAQDGSEGWAMFDISSIPDGVTINSVNFHFYVNNTNWPWWYIGPISSDPLTASASVLQLEINGINGSTNYVFRQESSSYATGQKRLDLGTLAASDMEAALSTDKFVIGINSDDDSPNYYITIDGWNESNPPYLEVDYFLPSCFPSANVTVANITSSSANVSWTSPGNSVSTTLEYGPSGFNSGNGTTVSVSGTNYSLNGLAAGTTYDVRLIEDCGNVDGLSTETSVSFSTPCPSSFVAPYSTSFEFPGVGDPCWNQDSNDDFDWTVQTGATPDGNTGPDSAANGNYYLYTEGDGPGAGDVAIFASPDIDLSSLNNPTVRFQYHMRGTSVGSLDLEVENPAGSGNWTLVWSEIGSQSSSTTDWLEAVVPLTPFAGQNVAFRFYGTRGSSWSTDIAVDDFSVEEEFCVTPYDVVVDPQGLFADVSWTTLNADSVSIAYREVGASSWDTISGLTSLNFTIFGLDEQTGYELTITAFCSSIGGTATTQVIPFTTSIACPDPFGGSTSGVTTNSADLSWNTGGSSTWDIQYGSSGFIFGQGTNTAGVTSNPYTLGNLTPGTTYDWYVRDDCGANGTSDWVGPYSFLTLPVCAPGTRKVIIDINTSSFGNEVSWDIRSSTGVVMASGSGYASSSSYQSEACLADGEVYTFFAYDSWGDGWNGGTYTVSCESSGTVLANNGGATPNNGIGGSNPNDTESTEDFTTDFCYCTNASGMTVSSASATDVLVSWTAGGNLSGPWDLVIVSAGSDPNSGTPIAAATGLTSTSYTFTGLSLSNNTTYDVYVAEFCTGLGLMQPFSSNASFTTPDVFSCSSTVVAPSTEGFEGQGTCSTLCGASCTIAGNWMNVSFDDIDWAKDQFGTGSGGTGPPSGANGSSTYIYTEASSPCNSGNPKAVLESTCFDLSSLNAPALSFWGHFRGQSIGRIDVEVSSASSNWTVIWSRTGAQGNSWLKYSIDLGAYAGQTVKFRISHQIGSGFYGDAALDDITVGEVPCTAPVGIAVDAVSGTGVTLSWSASPAALTYDIGVWNAGDDPLVDAPVASATGVTGTSASLSGLTLQSNYDVYVQSNCSGGAVGQVQGPSFQTACASLVAPYMENFDGSSWGNFNTYDPCWNVESTTAPNWEVDNNFTSSAGTGPSGDVSGSGRYIFLETSSPALFGESGYIETPFVDISGLTNPGFTFYYHMYGSAIGTLEIQARSSGSFQTIWSLSGQQQTDELDPWLPAFVDLSGFSSPVQFRIVGTIGHTGNFAYLSDMAVDEFFVGNVCQPTSSNLTVSNVLDASADVSWTGSSSSYIVEVVPAGQSPTGSGTSVSGTSTSLTGLTAESDYVVYVYGDCGFGLSTPVQQSFSTGYCPAQSLIPFSALPYTEGFDVLPAPKVPCGWLVDDRNADNIVWETQDRSSLSQSNPNALEIIRNTSDDMDDWIFSPEFEVPANTSLDIIFSYRVRTNQYVEKLEVFVGSGQNPADMNLKLFDVSNLQNSFYKSVTVSYTATAAENIFIGLHGYSDADQFALYIDDFEVKEADCPTPFLLSGMGTGQTTAQLAWNGPGDVFIVEYGPAGFAPGTGTTVLASSSSLTLTGLEVGSDYEFYVQNDCNGTGDGLSPNAGPASFSTDCPSITASSVSSCPDGSMITLTGTPAGGTFSGPGVSGGKFDPTAVHPGTYTISYRVPTALGNSCAGTIDITVNPFPNVTFGDLGSYCDGQNGFTITTASPTGGVFSGPGIVGGDFVPAQIGVPGTYTLYYTYTDVNGCTAMDSASVTLIPTPNVNLNASQTSFCGVNDSTVTLNGTPAGGVFSGPGVVNGVFDPSIAGLGTHTIRYTVSSGSCSTQDQLVMTVNQVPSVTASPDVVVLYGQGIQLSAVATGGSGNYTYQWSPADSILGTTGQGNQVTTPPLSVNQQFVVRVTDNVTGCRGFDTVNVTIFGGPISITLSSNKDTICVGETVELYAEVDGGSDTTYSFLWTPSSYMTDLHDDTTSSSPIVTTTYAFYVDDSFSQKVEHITIYVNPLPNVTFSPIPNPCVDGAAMMMSQGSPAGGTYYGPGVAAGMFDPAAAGVGTHTLTYTYVNANGCGNSATRDVIVAPKPTVTMSALADVCTADAPFALTVGAPTGGTYSGPGVSNGMFDPAAAGDGTFTINYTYTNANGCTESASTTIVVNPAAIGFHLPIPDVCTNQGPVTLTGAIPPGGTYTGPGVNGGTFYPSQVGLGTYTLDYTTVSVTGCPIEFQATIVVNAVPSVSTSNFANTCASAVPIALTGGSPAGGTWSGSGVSGGNFDPSVAGAGTHVLTYSYSDGSGCVGTSTSTIVVEPAPNVSLYTVASACVSGGTVPLISGSPAGGTHSGPGVTGTTFDPAAAGVGTHTITYSYTNAQGCAGTATSTINVTASPSVSLTSPGNFCKNGAPGTLSGTPGGGVFSGPGVSGGSFNPALVAPGTYTIVYTYTDANGCSGTDSQSVTVDPLPAAPTIVQNGCDLTAQSSATNPTYTWLDAQGNTVGTGATITTPCTGLNIYYLVVEDGSTGCSATSSRFIADYVSLEDELTDETIEVFPNPNRGSFSVSIAQLSADNVEVVITDARGRVVMEEQVDHVNGSGFDRDYNLSEVENGVYFIRVSADGHSSVKRIVIE